MYRCAASAIRFDAHVTAYFELIAGRKEDDTFDFDGAITDAAARVFCDNRRRAAAPILYSHFEERYAYFI